MPKRLHVHVYAWLHSHHFDFMSGWSNNDWLLDATLGTAMVVYCQFGVQGVHLATMMMMMMNMTALVVPVAEMVVHVTVIDYLW